MHCKAHFMHDYLDGDWQKWDDNGKLIKKITYQNGVIDPNTLRSPLEPLDYPGDLGSSDFAFILAQGSGWHGYNTLRVSASGHCDFRYFLSSMQVSTGANKEQDLPEGTVYREKFWRKADFQLTKELQKQLRDALQEANVFAMKDEYIQKEIADGTQWIVRLRAGRKEKRVYCSNTFPERLLVLSRTLREQIIVPYKMEILTATRIKEDAGNPEKEGWPEDTK